jgi:methylated-DNA-[protein]-cysteine S-methyltransferase
MTNDLNSEAENDAAQFIATLLPTRGVDSLKVMAALRARLAERAASDGLLDVAYRTIDSPVGELLVATTEAGLVRVAFAVEDFDTVLAELAATISPRILKAAARTDKVARQIDEYFAGDRRSFDLNVDLQLVSGFRRTVIAHLSHIEYGNTASYAAIASAVGNPAAVRAVGSACSHNPVPVVIPCHRVIRSDGAIGQYLGGVDAKTALLALEAAA